MTAVSVIVPCYNAGDFLSATIESILRQEMSDWELILVDDGSNDNTWEIIDYYVQIDSRVKGFQKSNEGTTRTRNRGLSESDPSSRYIMFLDHDDELEPHALTRMCGHLDAHPDVGLVACQLQKLSTDGRKLGAGKRSRWVPGFILPRELGDDEIETPFVTFFCATGQGPFALYRRSVYLQTEGWDESFWPHEDTDMFCQMALLAKVHFLPDRLYLKRIHAAQGMGDRARVQRAYVAFRAKWDKRSPGNAHEASLLREAKKYYYSMHRPCRDLKVAWKALLEFFKRPSLRRLHWFASRLISALDGFVIKRFAA